MKTVCINPDRCGGSLQCVLACVVVRGAGKDETLAFFETRVPRRRGHVPLGARRVGAISADDEANEAFSPMGIAIHIRRPGFRHRLGIASRP
jgi:hypothetical protein